VGTKERKENVYIRENVVKGKRIWAPWGDRARDSQEK